MFSRKSGVLLISIVLCIAVKGQGNGSNATKPVIGPSEFGKFSSVPSAAISNDGKYAIYSVDNPLTSVTTRYLTSLQGNLQINLGASICLFTDDSKDIIFKRHDSLFILTLNDQQIKYIAQVGAFRLKGDYLAYQEKLSKKLFVETIESRKDVSFENVSNYFFNRQGNALVMQVTENGAQALQIGNLATNTKETIWNAADIASKTSNFTFSKSDAGFAFVVEANGDKSIWYSNGSSKAIKIVDKNTKGIDDNLLLDGIDNRGFSNGVSSLFITLKETERQKANPDAASVDVWSYTDGRLQSDQLKKLKSKTYVALLDIDKNEILRIEYTGEKLGATNNKYGIVTSIKGDATYDEWYWNKAVESSVYLVSLEDGKRKLISNDLPVAVANSYWLSPAGKYIVYYNASLKNYFSYEIESGTRRNITKGIVANWTTYAKKDIKMAPYWSAVGMFGRWTNAGWVKDDKGILLLDQYDIYQVDPAGIAAPVCLTGGIGFKNNIEFRDALEKFNAVYEMGEHIIVSGFNRANKNDGFYELTTGVAKPLLLSSQPCLFKGTWENERFYPEAAVKAADVNIYLVKRMTAEESPNYYWTSNFKSFNRITDVHPEGNYNWLTTELISFNLPDGTSSQGILYKPENFDANKKYPVIFHYYERMTEGLHGFIMPNASLGDLNIPYFVSNGYLVFTPDIHYTIGHPGKSVVNTVVAAANYLSKLPYVDSKHMGLQGHSRGGWETNFIITHSDLFAAATSASGFCNYVSLYNGVRLLGSGVSRQIAYEQMYQRIGATLWEKPELFIENSPIFKADKVKTPLLMMSNKDDDDVPFDQGIEFFTALRRLGKRVWLLQYDGERHLVSDKAALDYTIRMKQFFDHYLKNAPAPKWMTRGIPAIMKGIDDGLELDTEIKTPGLGLYRQEKIK